jgi:hypothetical protein
MLFIIVFLLLTFCHSNVHPADELMDLDPKDAWECLCAKFRELKQLGPERLKVMIKSRIFKRRVKIFRSQLHDFFGDLTLEAFTALDSASKDTGMVLFFVRFLCLWDDTEKFLIDYGEIHFSFEEISRNKKLSDWKAYLNKTIEYLLKYINCDKTSELLSVVLRILQNLKRKIGDDLELDHLETGIKILKHEKMVLDMNLNESTPEETFTSEKDNSPKAESENSVNQAELFVDPKITFIHENLLGCFNEIRAIFRSEGSSKGLLNDFCKKLHNLILEFDRESGDLSILLNQRIEFVLVIIDHFYCLMEDSGTAKLRSNFETLFQGPMEERKDKIGNLAESCQNQLAKMIQFTETVSDREKFCLFGFWGKTSKILKNSVEDFTKISKKINRQYPSSKPNPLSLTREAPRLITIIFE